MHPCLSPSLWRKAWCVIRSNVRLPIVYHRAPLKLTRRKIHLWRHADIDKLKQDACSFTTSFIQTFTTDSSIHTMWYYIKSNLTDLHEQHVPSKFTTTRFHQPWITTEIKRITRRKQRAYSRCRTKPTTSREHRKYRELQKQTKQLCKSAYNTYINNIISPDNSTNPKGLYSYIKHQRNDHSGIQQLQDKDGFIRSDTDSLTKVNIINQHFQSVFTQNEDTSTIPDKCVSPHPLMQQINTIIRLKSVSQATFADCRSQFFLDRLGRCLKLIVSYRGTSSHECASQCGLAFLYTWKTSINYRECRPSLNCLLNEKGRNAGLAGDRSTVSGKHTRAFNGHSTDRLNHTTKTTSQNGDNKSLYIHALKMWFRNWGVLLYSLFIRIAAPLAFFDLLVAVYTSGLELRKKWQMRVASSNFAGWKCRN